LFNPQSQAVRAAARAAQEAFGAQILIEIGPVNAEASGTLSPMGALFGRW